MVVSQKGLAPLTYFPPGEVVDASLVSVYCRSQPAAIAIESLGQSPHQSPTMSLKLQMRSSGKRKPSTGTFVAGFCLFPAGYIEQPLFGC